LVDSVHIPAKQVVLIKSTLGRKGEKSCRAVAIHG
jgi:hypothetical protein